jgi:hypothetical protein
MHTEIFAHSLSTPLPTPPTHTVDTEKQQTILFSIETVIQGICAKDGTVIQPTEAISNNERATFWDANDRVSEQIQFRRFLFFSFVLLYVSAELSIRSVRLLFVCVCRARGGRMNFVIVDVVRHSFRCRLSKMGNALKCCPVGNG